MWRPGRRVRPALLLCPEEPNGRASGAGTGGRAGGAGWAGEEAQAGKGAVGGPWGCRAGRGPRSEQRPGRGEGLPRQPRVRPGRCVAAVVPPAVKTPLHGAQVGHRPQGPALDPRGRAAWRGRHPQPRHPALHDPDLPPHLPRARRQPEQALVPRKFRGRCRWEGTRGGGGGGARPELPAAAPVLSQGPRSGPGGRQGGAWQACRVGGRQLSAWPGGHDHLQCPPPPPAATCTPGWRTSTRGAGSMP